MTKTKANDNYPADEANKRFEAALRGAFATPAKPMKDIPRKRLKAKRKPRKSAKTSV